MAEGEFRKMEFSRTTRNSIQNTNQIEKVIEYI